MGQPGGVGSRVVFRSPGVLSGILRPSASPSWTSRRPMRVMASGKGFSKKAREPKQAKDASESGKRKEKRGKVQGKKTARVGPQPIPRQLKPQEPRFVAASDTSPPGAEEVVDVEFEKRLAMVEMEGKQKQQKAAEKQESVLQGDIYSNPPPLSATILGESSSSSSDSDIEGSFGPRKIAITGISIFALVAFAVTSLNSDLVATSPQPTSESSKARKLQAYEKEKAMEAAKKFEATLVDQPGDLVALEGAAVTYAELGEYGKAIPKLEALAAAKPDDPDVLRLLAETQAANKDIKSAISTYRKADAASQRSSLEIQQGISSILVKDKQEGKAVEELVSLRKQVEEGTKEADFSAYEVDLLMASVYSQWPGHNNDAFKIYDALIKTYPDDFRGYLAKGVLLRTTGQKGDAERMFIQAKYLAPKEAMSVVQRVINPK